MKKVLVISPYFPPSNAADMQRVRMSLPFFKSFGWEAEVVCVADEFIDINKDPYLLESVPSAIKIHKVAALSKKWTSKFGLGSIAIRSLWFYKKRVDTLLKSGHYDLIYFSTTQFPICILGAYWKKKFGVPYVVDMQDPWHSTYYEDKPKSERPPKYWFSYRLNKWLEPMAMKAVSGLISVSEAYINTLEERYPRLKNVPTAVITFGAFEKDFDIVKQHEIPSLLIKTKEQIDLVYIGRGGYDMKKAISLLFEAFKKGLEIDHPWFSKLRFHFIGTSYAPKGMGIPSIKPVAEEMGIADYVDERTDRIPFYSSISTLLQADALIIPGSDDPAYTASKIYPYILAKKPLLGIFNAKSSAGEMIKHTKAGAVADINEHHNAINLIFDFLTGLQTNDYNNETDWSLFDNYTAKEMTKKQTQLFEVVLSTKND